MKYGFKIISPSDMDYTYKKYRLNLSTNIRGHAIEAMDHHKNYKEREGKVLNKRIVQ